MKPILLTDDVTDTLSIHGFYCVWSNTNELCTQATYRQHHSDSYIININLRHSRGASNIIASVLDVRNSNIIISTTMVYHDEKLFSWLATTYEIIKGLQKLDSLKVS